jgi:putative antitoxin of VapBC-like toxin-antitoxin system
MIVSIDVNDELFHQAKKLTRLRSPEKIVLRALELLVQSEARKGISLLWFGHLAGQFEEVPQESRFALPLSS